MYKRQLVSFLWFSAFGGTVLSQQIIGHTDLLAVLDQGYQYVLFAMLEHLPMTVLLSWVAIVLLLCFFVTSADSATLVLASMSSESADDPPLSRRIVWGVLQAGIAVALLAAGGLDALQAVVIVAALPFALLLAAVVVSLRRELRRDLGEEDRVARELRHAEQRWLAQERAQNAVDNERARAAYRESVDGD